MANIIYEGDILTGLYRVQCRAVPKARNGWKSTGRDIPAFYVYTPGTDVFWAACSVITDAERIINPSAYESCVVDVINEHGTIIYTRHYEGARVARDTPRI